MVAVLPFGSWPSPLSAQWASSSARFDGAAFVGDEVWWGESLPADGGRTTVRRRTAAGTVETLLPSPWSARSRVHEYGGGAWTATESGVLLFVEKTDQRVWALAPDGSPRALTPEDPSTRYGGLRWQRGVLLAVRERDTGGVPDRAIVRISLDEDAPDVTELVSGADFVAQPDLSPDGTRLAWVAWRHPHMPWDRTEVRIGTIGDGGATDVHAVTAGETSALQPTWRSDDELVFLDEPTGRWNLWAVDVAAGDAHAAAARPLAPADADTGGGLWVLGQRWYAVLAGGRIAAIRTNGADALVLLSPDGRAEEVALPATSRLTIEDARTDAVLVSGAGRTGTGIWLVTAEGAVSRVAGAETTEEAWMPVGEPVTYAGPNGDVHAFDFAPTNPEVRAPDGERPPYVVFVHGGPTAHVAGVADAKTAFFTSRGIGVLDVNYGGSTGYGRAYRERLTGQWGVVDVGDVAAAASGLAADGRADPARLAIEGGSAGGWTVLGALVRTDVFRAGISRYGVGDARALAADTHDFEAHYLDGLIGPLPEAEALYVERSPLSHPEGLNAPLLILQGTDDAVVPPAQAEAIRDALAARGIPHSFVLYEGEGHGFRRADTIVDALEREIAFLGAVFGFDPPGIPPIVLE